MVKPCYCKKIYLNKIELRPDSILQLMPDQEGGGRQTHSLRLKDKNGKEWVLRSVDKTYEKALDPIYKGSFISRIAKDQASTVHPYAALTVAYIIEPTGIYHPQPQLVYLPSQPQLGEFNKDYGDKLYFLEQRPDGNWEEAANFGHAKKIIGTDKLFEKIFDDNDNHVDQKAYLRARLFDMFMGDWGRTPDNWRWAEFDNGKNKIHKPIPRDRDQTFSIYDGL
ncbi:MAG: hypothetical protein C4308_11815 [Chitinophagaceae bacterium]